MNMAEKEINAERIRSILYRLAATAVPIVNHQTRVVENHFTRRDRNPGEDYMVEVLTKTKHRRFRKPKVLENYRIAIAYNKYDNVFTVYQPRWLGVLEAEMEAIASKLEPSPSVKKNFQVAWLVWGKYSYEFGFASGWVVEETGKLVLEEKDEMEEMRQKYFLSVQQPTQSG